MTTDDDSGFALTFYHHGARVVGISTGHMHHLTHGDTFVVTPIDGPKWYLSTKNPDAMPTYLTLRARIHRAWKILTRGI